MALVGERERERAVGRLRRHYVEGRLDDRELSERVELVLRARSRWQLVYALRNLPFLDEVAARGRHAVLLVLVGAAWFMFSAALLVAFVVWLVTNGVTLGALVAFPLVWAGVSALLYRRTVVSRRRLPG